MAKSSKHATISLTNQVSLLISRTKLVAHNGMPNMAVNRKHDEISMIWQKKLALFL